jgi:hypothetical protein
MKSIREVTARGSGHWYHAYDVELATWTTTWADSGGTRTRTLLKYELRINDARVPGPRYFSTDEERQAFIGRSFSDLTLRDLNPPQRGTVARPLAELVGQHLVAVVFVADYFELDWGNGGLDIYARARVKDATGWTEHSAPEYPDRLSELAGLELAGVDELLDRGLVLTFTSGTELVVPLSSDPALQEAAECWNATWYAGEPPFD